MEMTSEYKQLFTENPHLLGDIALRMTRAKQLISLPDGSIVEGPEVYGAVALTTLNNGKFSLKVQYYGSKRWINVIGEI